MSERFLSEHFLSEEDLDLANLSWEELLAWWDLWLQQAQASNQFDEHLYSHGVFRVEPGWKPGPEGVVHEGPVHESAVHEGGDEIDLVIRALKADFPAVEPDDYPVWGYPPPVQVIDCVLSLNRRYDAYVVPRVEAFVARHPGVRECWQLEELMSTFPSADRFLAEELGTDHPDRARVLAQVLDRVIAICGRTQDGSEAERLRAWAIRAKPREFSSFGVKGFGIAGFQYLRMLFGANTVKPDVHITRYVSAVIGRPVKKLEAVLLLEEAATRSGHLARHLDSAIWRKMSGSPAAD